MMPVGNSVRLPCAVFILYQDLGSEMSPSSHFVGFDCNDFAGVRNTLELLKMPNLLESSLFEPHTR